MATILKTLLDEAHAAADEQVLAEQLGDSLTETLVKHDSAQALFEELGINDD